MSHEESCAKAFPFDKMVSGIPFMTDANDDRAKAILNS